MIVGVAREVKDREYRVGMVPTGAERLAGAGHRVLVEEGAGEGSGFPDGEYRAAGAEIVSRDRLFSESELLVKVKEPVPSECPLLRPGQILFTFLHLASSRELAEELSARGVTAIGYETVVTAEGGHPLLAPMSRVAGRLAVQMGMALLRKDTGGIGILLGGVEGAPRGRVTVVGGGTVGINAAEVARGIGAQVAVLDRDPHRLARVNDLFGGAVGTLASNPGTIGAAAREADLLVGAVYVHGAKAPIVVTEEVVRSMRPGSVIVDVAIDQGGCVATSRPTTHSAPTYLAHGVIHYCVTNMPGIVPRTSTFALTNATFPYVEAIASQGLAQAVRGDASLGAGVNVAGGKLVKREVAEAHGLPWEPLAL